MAEGTNNDDSNSWESWFGGWVQAAKETSSTALEFVKKDLAEFSTTLQKETEKAIEKTSLSLSKENTEQATTKVKAGISSFLGNISKALVIPPSDEYVPVKVSADGTTLYDRGKARLHAIQLDASTYIDPPRGSREQYDMWLDSFDMAEHKGEISEILVSKVEVRALYTKLVPNEVSHADFWQRYFYRVHQLQCDEARKQALMQRADRTHGDSLSWDDEDDWSGGEEDDGNQSDWEKMPRPHQQTSSSLDDKSSNTKSPPSQTDSAKDPSTDNLKGCSKPEDEAASPSSTIEQPSPLERVSDSSTTSSGTVSCDNNSTPCEGLQTVHDHFSADPVQEAETNNVTKEHNPPHISTQTLEEDQTPCEIACASTPNYLPAPEDSNSLTDFCHQAAEESSSTFPVASVTNSLISSMSGAAGAMDIEASSPQIKDNSTEHEACGAADSTPLATSKSLTSPQGFASSLSSDSLPTPKDTKNVDRDSVSAAEEQLAKNSSSENRTDESKVKEEDSAKVQVPSTVHEAEPEKKLVEPNSGPELPMRVKGDMVVVGEMGTTASSDSSDAKGLDDDWEEDFGIELTEEDLKAAEYDIAKRLEENLDIEDDWESWE